MHIDRYAAARLRLARRIAEAPSALRRALRQRFHKLGHAAHHAEHGLHVAYLGGVAFGGGYRYAAIGMLVAIVVAWLCAED